MPSLEVIALIGGTGAEGLGLATRFAVAGRSVIIGSRQRERAEVAAEGIRAAVPGASARGLTNEEAAAAGGIIIVTVPYEAQVETLTALREAIGGKVVVDAVVPLKFERGVVSAVVLPEGSAAGQAAALLPQAKIAAAFHHLGAPKLMALPHDVECDVVVCADDSEAKAAAIELAACIPGCRGVDGGGLANASYVEAFTAVLIGMNRKYKTRTSVRITGI
jgi:NADPH-dependent F420 reductase